MLNADERVENFRKKTLDIHCFLSPVEAGLRIFRTVKLGIENSRS